MSAACFTMTEIERLTGFQLGLFDVACPECGAGRREQANRKRKVLRIWRKKPDFASYKCQRCGIEGWARREDARQVRNFVAAKPAHTTLDNGEERARRQHRKAQALWRRRLPAASSPVEAYLRNVRGFGGSIPETIGYLSPLKPDHHSAIIAAFGLCEEPKPGELTISDDAVLGIHLTLLKPDGRGKADIQPNKIMVGPSYGWPIVLAPPNDLLGLVICEGIETGLSLFEATGCGVWAAGAAGRMPALTEAVPDYVDTVNIAAEQDEAGRKGAFGLAERLRARGLHVELNIFNHQHDEAA